MPTFKDDLHNINIIADIRNVMGRILANSIDTEIRKSLDDSLYSIAKIFTKNNHRGCYTKIINPDNAIKIKSKRHINNIFIAVGVSGTIVTSHDTITWTSRDSGTTNNLLDITYGNNLYVAVGTNGTIVTSTDGITWIKRASYTCNTLNNITYGNGKFIAIGANGTILVSSDGIGWDTVKWPNGKYENTLWSIVYAKNKFIIVGNDGTFLISSHGEMWNRACAPYTLRNFYSVTYGDNQFIAVGENGTIFISYNGLKWIDISAHDKIDLYRINYVNHKFIVSSTDNIIMTSNDGANWSEKITINRRKDYDTDIIYGNNIYLTIDRNNILTSPDCITWTSKSSGIENHLYKILYIDKLNN